MVARPKWRIPCLEARRLAISALVGLGAGLVAADPPLSTAPGGRVSAAIASGTGRTVELVAAPEGDRPATTASPVQATRTRFPSGRSQVAVEVYTPQGPGPHPVVVLLHGARPNRAMPHYRNLAEDLARRGFVTAFVRYYERGAPGRGVRADWRRSLSDAITFASSISGADPERVGVVGFSLGAFLALEQAPRDHRVDAVVAFYGGLSRGMVEGVEAAMPPTLLVHGGADRVVPVWRSVDAAEMLRSAGCASDVLVYPHVRHGFGLNSRGGADGAAARDAWERAVAFLGCHLRRQAPFGDAESTCPSWVDLEARPVPALLNPSLEEVRRAAVPSAQRHAGG